MKVLRKLPLSLFPPHPVLTIGNFDGQHVGHRALVTSVVELAQRYHGTPMVLTFEPHPARILSPGVEPSVSQYNRAKTGVLSTV